MHHLILYQIIKYMMIKFKNKYTCRPDKIINYYLTAGVIHILFTQSVYMLF